MTTPAAFAVARPAAAPMSSTEAAASRARAATSSRRPNSPALMRSASWHPRIRGVWEAAVMTSTDTRADVLIVGGGIAGVSVAYELSRTVRVTLLEMEPTLAYHTTGRSAATFLETYGGEQIRALTTGSRAFFADPPEVFESTLMTPRPSLQFATTGRAEVIERMHAAV